jgi:hypothetical protein
VQKDTKKRAARKDTVTERNLHKDREKWERLYHRTTHPDENVSRK